MSSAALYDYIIVGGGELAPRGRGAPKGIAPATTRGTAQDALLRQDHS